MTKDASFYNKSAESFKEKLSQLSLLKLEIPSSGPNILKEMALLYAELYYLSGFLNMPMLCRLCFLGKQFIARRMIQKISFTSDDQALIENLNTILTQELSTIAQQVDYGDFISPDVKSISPLKESISIDHFDDLVESFTEKEETLPQQFPNIPLRGQIKKNGEWHINVPASTLVDLSPQHYYFLSVIKPDDYSDIQALILLLKSLKKEGVLLRHGVMELPESDELNYYVMIKSQEDEASFWDERKINAQTLQVFASPQIELPIIVEGEVKKQKQSKPKKVRKPLFSQPGEKISFPIGLKMLSITAIVLTLTMSAMIAMATYFFLEDTQLREEEANLKISYTIATQLEETLNSIGGSGSLLVLGTQQNDSVLSSNYQDLFFSNQKDIIMVGISNQSQMYYNDLVMLSMDVSQEFILSIWDENMSIIQLAMQGLIGVQNLSPYFGEPVIGLTFPYRQGRSVEALIVILRTSSSLQKHIEARGITTTFICDAEGNIIGHPNEAYLIEGQNAADIANIDEIFESSVNTGQSRFEKGGEFFLSSYSKTNIGRMTVITTVSEDLAFESIFRIQQRNIYLMLMCLSIAFIIIYFYSRTLSRPIRHLVKASTQISSGDYKLNLKPGTRDEVGVLTKSFVEMGMGLEEKERIKDAFGRFVNKDIADLASKGEISLGGENKRATIFFSDIRSFTAISETLSPEEVVGFLNEYMTLMVECVNTTHGVVDKYIGDAIMAIWGTPVSRGNDSENAINASLMMRQALRRFNSTRGGARKPIIKIGCGINEGDVLAGQIGSQHRMEYTVIGDAVNFASRIEALNKPFGTDVLISEDTAKSVKNIFHLVKMKKIKVKGKKDSQQIYAVLGRKDDPDCPKDLKELRHLVGVEGVFSDSNDELVDQDEIKYEIMD